MKIASIPKDKLKEKKDNKETTAANTGMRKEIPAFSVS